MEENKACCAEDDQKDDKDYDQDDDQEDDQDDDDLNKACAEDDLRGDGHR